MIPDEIKNKTYVITYPNQTREEVKGEDLYKFEGTYIVETKGENVITISDGEKEEKIKVNVDNFIEEYQDGNYKYVPLKGGYSAETINKDLQTYNASDILTEVNGVPVNKLIGTFDGCRDATTIDFTNFDMSHITNVTYLFYGCDGLTNIDLTNLDTSNVTNMHGLFDMCDNLKSVNMSNLNTRNVTNMAYMFNFCRDLTDINLNGISTENVTDMESMFNRCWSLTSIDLSDFNTSKVTTMEGMFYGCQVLNSLDLSNFDTRNVKNMFNMFYGTDKMSVIYVGENWTTENANTNRMFESSGVEGVTKK